MDFTFFQSSLIRPPLRNVRDSVSKVIFFRKSVDKSQPESSPVDAGTAAASICQQVPIGKVEQKADQQFNS